MDILRNRLKNRLKKRIFALIVYKAFRNLERKGLLTLSTKLTFVDILNENVRITFDDDEANVLLNNEIERLTLLYQIKYN
jgi:hypothetical protein